MSDRLSILRFLQSLALAALYLGAALFCPAVRDDERPKRAAVKDPRVNIWNRREWRADA